MDLEKGGSAETASSKTKSATAAADESASAVAESSVPQSSGAAQGFSWRLATVFTIVILGLGFLGFALTNYAPKGASWYWVVVLPAFAAMGIWQTWASVRKDGKTNWQLVRKQIYHWLALFVAIKILFVLIATGNIDREDGGLVALLLMALTCTLVGVNFDWIFIPIGVLLGAVILVAGCFKEYVWLVLLGAGLAVVLLLALQRLVQRRKKD
jgi:hypothetical protein